MIARAIAVALALVTATSGALASPRLLPPPRTAPEAELTTDDDLRREAASLFWGDAVDPGAAGRRAAMADAVRALRLSVPDLAALERSLTRLAEAAPDEPDPWGYLAIVAERRRAWATCGRALRALAQLAPDWRPDPSVVTGRARSAPPRAPAVVEAGCWLRAGDVATAREVVDRAIDRGESSAEVWLVAGQVALAEGRLGDAVDALGRSRGPTALWLTALALDRAGRDGELAALATSDLDDRRPPWLPDALPFADAADADYAIAVAARRNGRLDRAVVFFRRYLHGAALDAPWRPRAEAQLRALAMAPLDAAATVRGSDGDLARRNAALAAVTAQTPAMAACLAAVPTGLVEISITAVGPAARAEAKPSPFRAPRPSTTSRPSPPPFRATHPPSRPPPPPRGRPIVPPRPVATIDPGQSVGYVVAPLEEVAGPGRADALECVGRALARAKLPRPAAGGYLTVTMPVRAR